jgi:hypothetical protein
MSRVESASGARYSTHKEKARTFEPIAPVGTNYTPVGKVDIAAIRRNPAPSSAGGPPSFPKPAPRPMGATGQSAASLYGKTTVTGNAPRDAWPDDVSIPSPPPPPPAAYRPPVIPDAPRPVVSVSVRI